MFSFNDALLDLKNISKPLEFEIVNVQMHHIPFVI